jgi:hypothetical protein
MSKLKLAHITINSKKSKFGSDDKQEENLNRKQTEEFNDHSNRKEDRRICIPKTHSDHKQEENLNRKQTEEFNEHSNRKEDRSIPKTQRKVSMGNSAGINTVEATVKFENFRDQDHLTNAKPAPRLGYTTLPPIHFNSSPNEAELKVMKTSTDEDALSKEPKIVKSKILDLNVSIFINAVSAEERCIFDKETETRFTNAQSFSKEGKEK